MDFIPLPDGVTSHELIPDLGGPDYDNLGFIGYGQRQGWNVQALREGKFDAARNDWDDYEQSWFSSVNLGDNSNTKQGRFSVLTARFLSKKTKSRRYALAAAFTQTWILYGIFHEALKRPVLRHELSSSAILKGPSGKVYSTKCITLRRVFGEFIGRRHSWDQDLPAASHLLRCLREAAMVINNLIYNGEFLRISTVPLSVYQALSALVEEKYLCLVAFSSSHLTHEVPVYVLQRYFAKQLQEQRGWCPNMTERIGKRLRIAGFYYASLVPGLITEQVHNQCKGELCIASNIDKERYMILHVQEFCLCRGVKCDHKHTNCPCKDIKMPEIPYRAAFEEGSFPLVIFQGDSIEIIKYELGVSFIAISHPWSDGRGNPAANALPICQLRLINKYVNAAARTERSIPFWIDTLCVPIEEPSRNTAILGMAKVYSSAQRVLVLSAELLDTKLPSTNHETLVRIFCSKWNTRLWLMHEAALAKDLVFQFSDRATNYLTLDVEVDMALLNPVDQSFLLAMSARNELTSTVEIGDSDTKSKTCSMSTLWRGLLYRTSSRVSDAAICASVLLGTDLSRVLAASDDAKIQTFWSCQRRVPASMLFVEGPRLKIDGFRWAPGDLLNPKAALGFHDKPRNLEAEPTADGLLVCGLEAVSMDLSNTPLELHVCRFSLPGSPHRYYFLFDDDEGLWTALREESGTMWNGRCVILLDATPSLDNLDRGALIAPFQIEDIEPDGERTRPISARYIQPVYIRREDEADTRIAFAHNGYPTDDWATSIGRRFVTDLVDIQRLDASQQWCIF